MFRMSADEIVDASVRGCRARYINHCCDPNCFAVITLPDDLPAGGAKAVAAINGRARLGGAADGDGDARPPETAAATAAAAPGAAALKREDRAARMQRRAAMTGTGGGEQGEDAAPAGADADGAAAGQERDVAGDAELDASDAAGSEVPGGAGDAEEDASVPRLADAGEPLQPPGAAGQRTSGRRVFVYALRRILKGEELTYDYQFPADEAAVPCKCGAANCRGTLNKQ
jgi:hypothetical protein